MSFMLSVANKHIMLNVVAPLNCSDVQNRLMRHGTQCSVRECSKQAYNVDCRGTQNRDCIHLESLGEIKYGLDFAT